MSQAELPFRDGDRVVFLGCSITQKRLYTNHIECYQLSHFPNWKLTFRNAGWGSDSAWMDRRAQGTEMNIDSFLKADAGEREAITVRMITHGLNRDVLPLKPTVVTIMYGANDASYGVDLVQPHIRGLQEIVTQLRKANIRAVLLGFTPQEPLDSAPNINLERYMAADREFATREKLPYVDLYHACMQAIREAQKADPSYRFTSDKAHPYAQGHAMMAGLILKGLGFDVHEAEFSVGPTPLMKKVIEKNDAYFHRWREIQIPALLANGLEKPETKAALAEADAKIAKLEAEIETLRKQNPR
jgi:lysophospholipase L1-like esterase